MNIALWTVQGLLAVAYLLAGIPKLTQPIATLSKRLPWASTIPAALVRFIGAAEILGAIGLILPMLTGKLTWLTVAAAIGLVVVQISAGIFHVSRNESRALPINIILLLLALFVAVGRVAIVKA